jgi:hypothetical protein
MTETWRELNRNRDERERGEERERYRGRDKESKAEAETQRVMLHRETVPCGVYVRVCVCLGVSP